MLHRRPRSLVLVLLLGSTPAFADAQQFVVDDAGVTAPGACQLEAWVSRAATWLLPACTVLGLAEVTAGIGYATEDHGDHTHREVEYVVQSKISLLPDEPGTPGASLVIGAGFGPFAQATGERIEGWYAYIPLSYFASHERWAIHLNGGWSYDRSEALHRGTYGARADILLTDRVAAIGEWSPGTPTRPNP